MTRWLPTARLGVLATLVVVSTAHFDAVVHDVASLAPRRKMMGMSEVRDAWRGDGG